MLQWRHSQNAMQRICKYLSIFIVAISVRMLYNLCMAIEIVKIFRNIWQAVMQHFTHDMRI